jgi:hypothetical protein
MHFTPLEAFLWGHVSLGVMAYAMRTVPQPKSVWGRWVIGILQFAVTNADKGQEALGGPPEKTSPAESMKL